MRKQSNSVIARLKPVLERRREALRRTLSGELSQLTNRDSFGVGDEIDQAIDSDSDEISSQLAAAESRELASIENALLRMRDGSYGLCEGCGNRIAAARLQALPYASHCIQCQRESETAKARPESSGANLRFLAPLSDDDEGALTIRDAEVGLT